MKLNIYNPVKLIKLDWLKLKYTSSHKKRIKYYEKQYNSLEKDSSKSDFVKNTFLPLYRNIILNTKTGIREFNSLVDGMKLRYKYRNNIIDRYN